MITLKLRTLIFTALFLFFLNACTDDGNSSTEPVFKNISELQEIKPHKPVKIKLKRNAKGEYSWDLSGIDADKIIAADKKLREAIEKK